MTLEEIIGKIDDARSKLYGRSNDPKHEHIHEKAIEYLDSAMGMIRQLINEETLDGVPFRPGMMVRFNPPKDPNLSHLKPYKGILSSSMQIGQSSLTFDNQGYIAYFRQYGVVLEKI